MKALRQIRALALLFVLVVLFSAMASVVMSDQAEASGGCCIWVMKCTVNPPIYCWEECIPCPGFP